MAHIPDLLIMPVAFEWNGRTWVSITNAMTKTGKRGNADIF